MTLDSNECPANPEEVAEKYNMGTLSKEEETTFEDHYVACNRCATLLERTAEYVEAMRAAAKEWTPDGHLRHSPFMGLRHDRALFDVVRRA